DRPAFQHSVRETGIWDSLVGALLRHRPAWVKPHAMDDHALETTQIRLQPVAQARRITVTLGNPKRDRMNTFRMERIVGQRDLANSEDFAPHSIFLRTSRQIQDRANRPAVALLQGW